MFANRGVLTIRGLKQASRRQFTAEIKSVGRHATARLSSVSGNDLGSWYHFDAAHYFALVMAVRFNWLCIVPASCLVRC